MKIMWKRCTCNITQIYYIIKTTLITFIVTLVCKLKKEKKNSNNFSIFMCNILFSKQKHYSHG